MNKTINFKTFKTFLQLILLVVSVFGFSQTNPDLEMAAGASNPTGDGPVLTTSINFQKNTNNPSGNTFAAYTPALSATYTISNSRYTTTVNNSTTNIGYGLGAATSIFPTMDDVGDPADANFTSSTSATGTGMSVTSNNSVRFNIMTYPLRVNRLATNGTHAMSDLTITFNRPVNNPVIHIGGLGGTSSAGLGYAARLDLVSSNLPTAGLSLTRLSGNNATGFQVSGLSIFNGANSITATGANSGSGSVRINGNGITSLTFTLSIRGDGAVTRTTAWASSSTDTRTGEGFTIGISNSESDLAVTKTVNNSTPLVGSNIVFTVTASNLGASNNSNVTVNDLLPSGYTYVSHTASTGTYVPGTGVWTIGNLNDQDNATLTITATVKSSGIYTNTTTITTSSGISDPNLSNNVASVTPLVQVDSDGDGVPDVDDLDDDNDGILDADENTCIASSKIEGTPIFINDFGTGAVTTDPYVLNHTYTTANVNDGFYNVRTSAATVVFHNRTNVTGDKDAGNPTITNGTTTGRYLMINIDSPNNTNKAIYRVTGINTQVGQSYRFRIDMAGLAEGRPDIPNLKIAIKDASNNELASATSTSIGMANDDVWRRLNLEFTATTSSVTLEIINQQPSGGAGNDVGIDNIILTPLYCDLDNDGTPNQFDLDSDNDGCPDAIEGDENVTAAHLNPSGSIIVGANGSGSLEVNANGVPKLVNGTTHNATGGGSTAAGVADIGNDQGQGIGDSQNAAVNSQCNAFCYKPAQTTGTTLDTNHGITALGRAGDDNSNWPMVRKGAWTVLEAKTKGFVVNRLTDAQITAIPSADLREGMMVYNISQDCLQINIDGTATGWRCFNTQTCPDL